MKFQLEDYFCGPATIQNALYILDIPSPGQRNIAKLCGTQPPGVGDYTGTSEEDMKRGALACGMTVDPYSHTSGITWEGWLYSSITAGSVVAVCVDEWDHWVLAFGLSGARYVVFDPSRSAKNKATSGVRRYTWSQLNSRVKAPKRVAGNEEPYYGIALGGKL